MFTWVIFDSDFLSFLLLAVKENSFLIIFFSHKFNRRRSGTHMSGSRSHNNLYSQNSADDASNSSHPSTPEHSPTNSPLRHNILSNNNATSTPCHHFRRSSLEPISFENLCRDNGIDQTDWSEHSITEPGCDISQLNEIELKNLQPLLWLELAAIFDRHNVAFDKRKPFKRKRKEEGNVFGVSLNALIRRDQQVTGEDSTLVPLLLQGILGESHQIHFRF